MASADALLADVCCFKMVAALAESAAALGANIHTAGWLSSVLYPCNAAKFVGKKMAMARVDMTCPPALLAGIPIGRLIAALTTLLQRPALVRNAVVQSSIVDLLSAMLLPLQRRSMGGGLAQNHPQIQAMAPPADSAQDGNV